MVVYISVKMSESDDEVPQLSADTLAALNEFYAEQTEEQRKLEAAVESGQINNVSLQENWVNVRGSGEGVTRTKKLPLWKAFTSEPRQIPALMQNNLLDLVMTDYHFSLFSLILADFSL